MNTEKTTLWDGGKSPFSVAWGKLYMWIFLLSDAFTFSSLLISYGVLRHKYAEVWPKASDVFGHFPFFGEQHIPLAYVGLMTFILILSSVTMVLAVEASHRKSKKEILIWLSLTIVGGFFFIGSQAWEWTHFIIGSEEGAIHLTKTPDNKFNGMIAHWANPEKTAILLPDGSPLTPQQSAPYIANAEEVTGANLEVNEYGPPMFGDYFFGVTGFHGFHVFSGIVINIIVLILVWNGAFNKKGNYGIIENIGLYWHFVDLVWVFVFTCFYLV
ncbi:MAG: cytochrome c oxidase subunit 3 [Bacteroidetes bacterium]|nr:cytochrome c oxidase subunit 3 [Bacteroidota bacterium]